MANYNESLEDAYKSSCHEGFAGGFGSGIVMCSSFSCYALAVWFGAKMILEKGYTGGDVLNVMFAILTGSAYVS